MPQKPYEPAGQVMPPPPSPIESGSMEYWIRKLIAEDNLHQFYASSQWVALAALARERQHNECQRCKVKGYYVPCDVVHHRNYVRRRPDLALNIDNLECLCHNCHNKEHKEEKSFLNEEKW